MIYYLAVSVKESNDNKLEIGINYKESIGLVYYNDGKEVFINLSMNYKTMEKKEFKSDYYYKCLIKGIWKKFRD